jgi:two-component system, sensor histidine kinase ChiS
MLHLLTLCWLVMPSAGGAADLLGDCRVARHERPAEAAALCEQALQAAQTADDRFEARMHLAELSTTAGAMPAAAEHLDQAQQLLARVGDRLAAHRLARRRALLAYRRGDYGLALAHFLEGAAAARALADQHAIAISENDLGVAYRRLGDDREALSHWLLSLESKRALGETDLAATENNIGNLYRDLGELDQAEQYLQRALAGHEKEGRVVLAAHTREDLGLLAAERSDWAAARAALDVADLVFVREDARADRLRLARHRAKLEWRAGDPKAAADGIAHAATLSAELELATPADMILLRSRLLANSGGPAAALAHLQQQAAALERAEPALQRDWRLAEAEWAEASGKPQLALGALRAAHAIDLGVLQQRHGERMDALRARFEFVELAHERDRLQRTTTEQALKLQQRRNQLLGLGLLSALVLALLLAFFQRRLYQQRLRMQQVQAEQRAQAEEARRVADSLRADLRSVRVALDQTLGPVLVVDAAGVVRLANAAAASHLQRSAASLRGQRLDELFGADAAAQVQAALESLSSGESESPISIQSGPANAQRIRALSLSLEEELGVLTLERNAQAPEWVESLNRAHAQWEQQGVDPGASPVAAGETADARHAIVELMQTCVETWERSTCSTRLELAEKSGIWRITIDDGRLRTRTLNRYLELATLPTRPRWREVLRTAYFILADCQLEPAQRAAIEQRISRLRSITQASTAASALADG